MSKRISDHQRQYLESLPDGTDELVVARLFWQAENGLTPRQAWNRVLEIGYNFELTTIRRAITDLTEDEDDEDENGPNILKKTKRRRSVKPGSSEHVWVWREPKQHEGRQLTAFGTDTKAKNHYEREARGR